MGPAPLHCFAFFLLFLHLTSGSGIDQMRLPWKPIKQSRKFDIQETHTPFFYSDATTVRDDTTPTFNPTDTTPVVNPTPPTTITSPTITAPTITPTMPTPTTTPTTPTATPITTPTTSPDTQTPSSGGSWCVASSSASSTALQVALDYACGYGGADCSAIQPGASCYNPDTVKDHASYAFNQYYQKNPGPTSCSFGGTAQITTTDPSSGSCHYASSSTTSTTTPPTPTTPTTTPMTPLMQSPPTPPSPTITTTPIGGSTVYGGEPVGSPNTAASMDQNSILLLGTTIMLMYVLLGVHP